MRESEFVFDSFDLVYYKLQKISLNRGRSYIDSPELWKNKKATVNPKNNNDKCFPYPITAALNYIQIDHLERIPKIKPFIEHFNWKEIDFPSNKKDEIIFELNNKSNALNILFVPYDTEEIIHAYKSKHNLKRESQVFL